MEEKKKIINIHLIEIAKMLKADSKMIRNYSLIDRCHPGICHTEGL